MKVGGQKAYQRRGADKVAENMVKRVKTPSEFGLSVLY
jgi:hypothetical protein